MWILWAGGNSPDVLLSSKRCPIEVVLWSLGENEDIFVRPVRSIMGRWFSKTSGALPNHGTS